MMNKMEKKDKKDKNRFRVDIIVIASFFVLLVSFCAYMINTELDDVLKNEFGNSVVTHDNTENISSEEK